MSCKVKRICLSTEQLESLGYVLTKYDGLYVNKSGEFYQRKVAPRVIEGIKHVTTTIYGYGQITAYSKTLYRMPKAHILVAEAFIPNPNGYTVVNHINGKKLDNRVENLEWCTQEHNTDHAIRMGLFNHQGSKNPSAKTDESTIEAVRWMHKFGFRKCEISKLLNLSRSQVHRAFSGWKHLNKRGAA